MVGFHSIFIVLLVSPMMVVTSEAATSKFMGREMNITCPESEEDGSTTNGGEIVLSMAGVEAGIRLVNAWKKSYQENYCPEFDITFETDTWSSGAARVCASSLIDRPVDISSMTGSFFRPQASTTDGWSFECKKSEMDRETVLVSL